MSTRPGYLLIDTDMLVLLSAAGLLEKVTGLLGYSAAQVRRLAAVPSQLERNKSLRRQFANEVLLQLVAPVSAIAVAPVPANKELLDALNDGAHANLDEGEIQLIALAAADDCTLLASGDKRAVKALAQSGNQEAIAALQGRIVSLEAVLWMLLQTEAPAALRAAFQPAGQHSTIRIVLSEHAVQDRDRCAEGIKSYYNELDSLANGLLFNPDPSVLGSAGSSAA